MSYMEIKDIFTMIDLNNDNIVSDSEWLSFFNLMIEPF